MNSYGIWIDPPSAAGSLTSDVLAEAICGPILGVGDVGGFLYADSTHELWSYRDGKVFWAGNERDESLVQGGIYKPKYAMAPEALLIGPLPLRQVNWLSLCLKGKKKFGHLANPQADCPH